MLVVLLVLVGTVVTVVLVTTLAVLAVLHGKRDRRLVLVEPTRFETITPSVTS